MSLEMIKVLVADDEYWVRENLRTIIDWQSHSFIFMEPAEDGEDALHKIQKESPDILITDISMPFLSGTELITRVRQDHPQIVCIALSGYSDYEFVRKTLVAGAMDYLLKPMSVSDLLSVLSRAVDRLVSYRSAAMENLEAQEKLRQASSIALDRELSTLVHCFDDNNFQDQIKMRVEEYDLIFSGFTMVMFHTVSLSSLLSKGQDVNKLILTIKDKISAKINATNSIVFNYIYKTNVFLLITDLSKQKLLAACRELVNEIGQLTHQPLTVAIGRYYFSFSAFRQAYKELQMALYSRDYKTKYEVLFADKAPGIIVTKRMTAMQEKQLTLSLTNNDRSQFQQCLYDEIQIQNCMKNGWTYIETRQTAGSIAWMLRHAIVGSSDSSAIMAMENLTESMMIAIENYNVDEMISALEQMLDEVFTSSAIQQTDSVRHTVFKVQDYINKNFFEELSLSSLSRLFYVDSSYLSKTFKQVVGENLMLYISKRRIQEAQSLMQNSKLSLTEISAMVGYGDYGYFNRVFHKVTGKSPKEFRKEGESTV